MQKEFECGCEGEVCEVIAGNVMDVDLKKCDSEVRADIKMGKKKKCVRLWGQVKDCDGRPVKDVLVKLLKSYFYHGKLEFEGIAHTITDCMGFYQFDVCPNDDELKFRIIVSKACTGNERVIEEENGECKPCKHCDDN